MYMTICGIVNQDTGPRFRSTKSQNTTICKSCDFIFVFVVESVAIFEIVKLLPNDTAKEWSDHTALYRCLRKPASKDVNVVWMSSNGNIVYRNSMRNLNENSSNASVVTIIKKVLHVTLEIGVASKIV